jgi:predicted MFS family arabinose efflux permease
MIPRLPGRFWAFTLAVACSQAGNPGAVGCPGLVPAAARTPADRCRADRRRPGACLHHHALAGYHCGPIRPVAVAGRVRSHSGRTCGFAYLIATDGPLWVLVTALGALGMATVVSGLVGDYALIPALAGDGDLAKANSIHMGLSNVAVLAGPAFGGLLVSHLGIAWVFWLDAASFLVAAAMALVLRDEHNGRARPGPRGMRAAYVWLRRQPTLIRLTLTSTVFNLGVGALPVFLTMSAQLHWRWSADQVGIALAVIAGTTFAGIYLGGALGSQLSLLTRMRAWLLACAVAAVLAGFGQYPTVVVAGLAGLYFFEGGMLVMSRTLRQQLVEPAMYGRANALIRCIMLSAIPVASIMVGFSVERMPAWARGGPIGVCVAAAAALAILVVREPRPTDNGSAAVPAGATPTATAPRS